MSRILLRVTQSDRILLNTWNKQLYLFNEMSWRADILRLKKFLKRKQFHYLTISASRYWWFLRLHCRHSVRIWTSPTLFKRGVCSASRRIFHSNMFAKHMHVGVTWSSVPTEVLQRYFKTPKTDLGLSKKFSTVTLSECVLDFCIFIWS